MKIISSSNKIAPYYEGELKIKRERQGFDLVLRAPLHLTIPIQESSTKTGQLLVQDCPIVVAQTV